MGDSQFQSFDDAADSSQSGERFAALRRQLAELDLDGFLVPKADEHQGEYTPPSAERLAWLTGFGGSAGLAVVLSDQAALFVDGRYTLQAAQQVDSNAVTVVPLAEISPETWIKGRLKPNARLGFDPWLHTVAQIEKLERAAQEAGASLVAAPSNPIDAIWRDRPAPPYAPAHIHPERFAGESVERKLARITDALDGKDALLISDPHALAWAFNLRGGDVSHTPIALGWALAPRAGRPRLYLDARKLTPEIASQLGAFAELVDPTRLSEDVARLGEQKKSLLFDAATAPVALVRALEKAGGRAIVDADPIALMKAQKNVAELRGARAAHLRDGVALTRFLAFLAKEAPAGRLTEISAAEALERFRAETGKLKDLSFPTISAFGPHAAIPHYRVTRASDRRIGRGLYLVDSGAQYEDGTTDVTRTIAVGEPNAEMRDRFTRVLKGHIAIARAIFPKGVAGAQLDSFARKPLWEAGLDFDHGTGHGVGSYLSVHEGPQRISKIGATPLAPGMIISNEPAYYKANRWGIRIENLVVVERRRVPGAEREVYGFETLTLAPIDRSLIESALLDPEEIAWLDAYHAEVREKLSPLLAASTDKWLSQATRPLRPAARAKTATRVTPGRRGRATRPR
jgi:Xaa-Pro aminopeptidase